MLVAVCGPPNAGKTTSSLRFPNVVHMDGTRLEDACVAVSGAEGDVCVEGVLPNAHVRRRLARAYAGRRVCVWLDIPFEECVRREARGRGEWMLRNFYGCFEPPTVAEGWDEVIRVDGRDPGQGAA